MDFKIRFAEKKDLDDLVDLQVEFESFFQNMGCDKYTIDRENRKESICELNFSQNPLLRTLVVEIEGGVVGRVSFYRGYNAAVPPIKVFHLSGILVRKEYRGNHLSERLFEKLIEIAKGEGVSRIFWSVWGPNDSAIKFYERIGGKFFQKEEDEHFMFLEI